jgi:hypothetical protein
VPHFGTKLQQFGLVPEPQKTAVSGTVQHAGSYMDMEFAFLRLTLSTPHPKAIRRGQTERNRIMRKLNKLVASGIAGSLLLATASTTSFALPVASNHQAVSEAAPAAMTDVRWRGRYWGWGVGAAALGLGIAAASAPYYYGGYYGPRYYGYYDPYYGGGCWRDRWGRVWCR